MIGSISGINQPWAPVQATRTASTSAPSALPTFETSDGASISSAATQASEPASAPSKSGASRLAGFATSLGLALCLAGTLSGCATMTGATNMQPNVRQEQTMKNPTLLNSVGSGTHKIADGFKDMGKGIGGVFVEGWNQVREGWNSTGDAAQKAPAPARNHGNPKPQIQQHKAR